MPMTFPSYAAAVLPFKFARRRWFDGVALVIGSAAPDMPYSLAAAVRRDGGSGGAAGRKDVR